MKNLLKAAGLTVALAGIGTVVPITALAATYRFHGSICNPDPPDRDAFSYSEYGIYNSYTGGAPKLVTCGLNLPGTPTVTSMTVVVYDRCHPEDVDCWLNLADENGTLLVSVPKSSAGYSSGSQSLTYTLPTPTAAKMASVQCTIPPGAASFVTTIVINTN